MGERVLNKTAGCGEGWSVSPANFGGDKTQTFDLVLSPRSRYRRLIISSRHNCFHAPEDVEVGMKMSLQNLGLDYGK